MNLRHGPKKQTHWPKPKEPESTGEEDDDIHELPTSSDYEFTIQAEGIGTPDRSEEMTVSGAKDDAKHIFPR